MRMVMSTLQKALFYFLLIIGGYFISCKKEASQPSWDIDVLAPLIKSSLSINDLLTDTLIKSNADSSIKIVYNTDFIKFSSDTLTKVPDTSLAFSYKNYPPVTYSWGGSTILIDKDSEIEFDLSGIELKTATIETELIRLHLENSIDSTIVFDYEIPCATLNGIPFKLTDSIEGKNGLSPTLYDTIISLAGYTVDLTGINKTKYNIVTSHVRAYISKGISYVIVYPKDSLYIINSAYNIKPSYGKGYLGQMALNVGPEKTEFNLFKDIKSGILSLPNVNIKMELENSIGVDARLKIANITAVNTKTGTNVNLICPSAINKSININRATETGNPLSPVNPSVQTININSGNSNITNWLSNMPDQLSYSMQVNVNPLGNVSGSNDFVYTAYGIKAKMNIEIPLSVIATDLTLSDTLVLDLSSVKGQTKINSGNLFLYATNGLPFDAAIQIYLLDNNLSKTDSLLASPYNIIASAKVGSTMKVTQATSSKLAIPVTKNKIDKLMATSKALVVARFNTSNQITPVNIYSYYKLDFKLIADLNYNISGKK